MTYKLNERLKEARKNLDLSQEYVAKILGVHRTVITAIELGTRKVSSEELRAFSEIYGLTLDDLIYGNDKDAEIKMFARAFTSLSEMDQKEIINLIDFKRRVKGR